MGKRETISLEKANEIALKHGFHSYGEFRQELYRYGITLEQFIKNGESFEPAIKSQKMPECVFNALTKRIIDLEDQKAETQPGSLRADRQGRCQTG